VDTPGDDDISVISQLSDRDSDNDQLIADAAKPKGRNRATGMSEFTTEDLVAVIKMHREIIQEAMLALTTAKGAATTQLPIRPARSRKMVDAGKLCCGAQDLDRLLTQLKHRFQTQSHQFHGDADHVDYGLSLLGKLMNYDQTNLRKTRMTNPDKWGTSLVTVSSPCLANFTLFRAEIGSLYGDTDPQLNSAIKAAGEYQQVLFYALVIVPSFSF
jgi:hypothetical protein